MSSPGTPNDGDAPRMGPLAKLPVFLNLDGRRAVLAGGTAPAAWKAELLAAAGAEVEVYAVELGEEMMALFARGASAGRLVHRPRPWSYDVLAGAAIALADAESDAEAEAFYCSARAAGVPVNVIDKPAYCQFQFGSIVNRSPIVVAISTDGAAPVLGQAIRQRIEALLPATLARWGAVAQAVRGRVGELLARGAERRLFWERFAERVFAAEPDANAESGALQLAHDIREQRSGHSGRVTLVGAGPGDAGHFTLQALRVLQTADVILHDDLVSPAVLELARREAQWISVGKRAGRESARQTEINEMLVSLARAGRHVVRLKSGDPSIFGRAGEEIAALAAHDIPVTVVPGVTAASALAAALGVSLTHRDLAQSVRFVTGHSSKGALPDDLDFAGLADPATTLVFYMARQTAGIIGRQLVDSGLPGATPVVVASSVSWPDMIVRQLNLSDLPGTAALDDLDGPVLVAIGRVFGERA